MDLVIFLIISMIVNAIFLHKYSKLKYENHNHRKALAMDDRHNLPTIEELMEVYQERRFCLYTFYAVFPFLDKWRKAIIEKGREGMLLRNFKPVTKQIYD